MDLLKKLDGSDIAASFLKLCEQGKAYVVVTHTAAGKEMVIYSRSGVPQRIVGDR